MRMAAPLLTLLLLTGCVTGPRGGVALAIKSAGAEQQPDMLSVVCEVELDNQTGAPLVVSTQFFSAFDGLNLLAYDGQHRLLKRQSSLTHQSPAYELNRFTLRLGKNAGRIGFLLVAFTNAPEKVWLQLEGTLPGSGYTNKVTSQRVSVTTRKAKK